MWDNLSMKDKATIMGMAVKSGITDLDTIKKTYNSYADGGYKVKKGDSLWRIAHNNNLTLNELMSYNPQLNGNINTVIHPGDTIYTQKKRGPVRYEYMDMRQLEAEEAQANRENLSAIMSADHDSNYGILDKKNHTLTIYSKYGKELLKTDKIITGKSGNDYNTYTKTDDNGELLDSQGNMSTPAGITVISGMGTYHGYPSFTRARVDNYGNAKKVGKKSDDIASALHFGEYREGIGSNGCVRVDGKTLCNLPEYIGIGTKIYTLPQQEGSRFEVRQGKLNFIADNPFGVQEGEKKYWDDYNTTSDKSYNPILISHLNVGDDYEYEGNIITYANSIMNGKKQLQKDFNLDSYTYDKLAQLAMGIAQQETKFNTSRRKKLKDYTPDFVLNTIRGNNNRSRGATQIKLTGDNKEMQNIYKKYYINEDNIDNMDKSAVATMARLAYIYNNEVRGRNFKGAGDTDISPWDALLYKWMGRNSELKHKTATPEQNNYISNVKKYIRDFSFEVGREIQE